MATDPSEALKASIEQLRARMHARLSIPELRECPGSIRTPVGDFPCGVFLATDAEECCFCGYSFSESH